jgi:hypothetical protein
MNPTRVVFLVYPNVTQLDLTGPAQVLSRLSNARVDLGPGGTISSCSAQRLSRSESCSTAIA